MKKTYLIASIILHLALVGISYLHFSNFLRSKPIKDQEYAVFDFVTIGPKSKAPVLSSTTGYTSKQKSEAKSLVESKSDEKNTDIVSKPSDKSVDQSSEKTTNKSGTDKPVSEKTVKQPDKKHIDKSSKDKSVKTADKNTKSKPIKPKSKSNKNNNNKSASHRSVSHKSDKALVNLKQKGKKSSKESLNSLLDSALADGDNENYGANAEEVGELTATQIDAVRQTIRKCWYFPAGLKDVESLIVDIKLELDRNGYVKKATTVDSARKNSDPGFRIAAENAERAVLDPACNPLPLPKDKYNEWKELELSFNPKDMM